MMKTISVLTAAILACGAAFALDGDDGDRQASFDRSVRMLGSVFAQTSSHTGADGTKVTCTILPQEQMAALALRIENAGNTVLTVGQDGVGLSSDGSDFEMIDTREAVDHFFKWSTEHDVFNETRESFMEIHNMPGQDMQESSFYDAAFPFGSSDGPAVFGLVYFACRMKDLPSVTASVKVNGEVYRFVFDGDGP